MEIGWSHYQKCNTCHPKSALVKPMWPLFTVALLVPCGDGTSQRISSMTSCVPPFISAFQMEKLWSLALLPHQCWPNLERYSRMENWFKQCNFYISHSRNVEYRNAEGGRKALAVVTNMTASFGNKLLNFSFNEILCTKICHWYTKDTVYTYSSLIHKLLYSFIM